MAIRTTGFYATTDEVFYVAPSGRAWVVSSPDRDGIKEIDPAGLPALAVEAGDLLTPDEALDYCRQVQDESGETLIEEA
jgi:hypothetical protein